MTNNQWKARSKVLGAAFLATLFIVPFKYAARDGNGAGAALGLLLSVSLLLLPWGGRRLLLASKDVRKSTLSLGWKLGLCAAFGNMAQGFGFAVLHPGLASVFVQMGMVFVAILSVVWLKEKLSVHLLAAVILCVTGIVFSQRAVLTGGVKINWGVAWAIGAALGFALMDLLSRKHANSVDLVACNWIRSLWGTLILACLPGAIPQLLNFTPMQWGAVFLAGFIGPGLARQLLLSAARNLPAVESSLIQQFRAVMVLPLGSVAFGVWPTSDEWVGAAFIVTGLFVPPLIMFIKSRSKQR